MFDEILLTSHEKRVLFKMRLRKRSKLKDADKIKLLEYELIEPNYTGEKNSIGEFIPDGTYSLADKYIRYRIYTNREFFHRLLLPITITLLTNAVVQALQWLLPWIQQMLG